MSESEKHPEIKSVGYLDGPDRVGGGEGREGELLNCLIQFSTQWQGGETVKFI